MDSMQGCRVGLGSMEHWSADAMKQIILISSAVDWTMLMRVGMVLLFWNYIVELFLGVRRERNGENRNG